MNKHALITAYKAMMYVVREEGLEEEVDEKYLKLDEQILSYEDYDVEDMIDNLENLYNAIDKEKYNELDEE